MLCLYTKYGYEKLGLPSDNGGGVRVHPWIVDGITITLQDFQHPDCPNGDCSNAPKDSLHYGTDGQTAIMLCTNGAHLIREGFWGYFKLRNGHKYLGCSTSEEYIKDGKVRQDFERGYLVWNGHGINAYNYLNESIGLWIPTPSISLTPPNLGFIRFKNDTTIYYVFNHKLYWVEEDSFIAMNGKLDQVIDYPTDSYTSITSTYPIQNTSIVGTGLIVKISTSSSPDKIYGLFLNEWHWFDSWHSFHDIFLYNIEDVVDITLPAFNLYPLGRNISDDAYSRQLIQDYRNGVGGGDVIVTPQAPSELSVK